MGCRVEGPEEGYEDLNELHTEIKVHNLLVEATSDLLLLLLYSRFHFWCRMGASERAVGQGRAVRLLVRELCVVDVYTSSITSTTHSSSTRRPSDISAFS